MTIHQLLSLKSTNKSDVNGNLDDLICISIQNAAIQSLKTGDADYLASTLNFYNERGHYLTISGLSLNLIPITLKNPLHNKSITGLEMEGIKISQTEFALYDFTGGYIREGTIEHSALRKCSFSEIMLYHMAFVDVNFYSTLFKNAKIYSCEFKGCDFESASFKGGMLSNCRFNHCKNLTPDQLSSSKIESVKIDDKWMKDNK